MSLHHGLTDCAITTRLATLPCYSHYELGPYTWPFALIFKGTPSYAWNLTNISQLLEARIVQ